MNQHLFDDLAKGLATNQLSRGQVLKGLAASLLLAGPLGSLLKKPAFAQTNTTGCVSPSCVDSAKQANAVCLSQGAGHKKKHHKKGHGHKKGKKPVPVDVSSCNNTFGEQLADCGCVTLNTNSSTNTTTPAACKDPCAAKTLSDQSQQNADYLKLVDYLTNAGFSANGSPSAGVFEKDGTLERSLLTSTYTNPTSTNEVAGLYYDVEADGFPVAFATVWDKQKQTLLYLLVVLEDNGQVQQVDPSAASQQTSMPSTGSVTAAAKTCDSEKLFKCRQAAAVAATGCLAKDCTKVCLLGVLAEPLCVSCVSICGGIYAAALIVCSEGYGCGVGNLTFCKNNVCCGLTETSCGSNSCCSSGQACCSGTCVDPGTDPNNCGGCAGSGGIICAGLICCSGKCTDTQADANNCGGCGKVCSSGQICCNGACIDTQTDVNNCGSCGMECNSAQTCVDGKCKSQCVPNPCTEDVNGWCCSDVCCGFFSDRGRRKGQPIPCCFNSPTDLHPHCCPDDATTNPP